MDEAVQKHRSVYSQVYDEDYYLDIFERVCENYGGLGNCFALQDPLKINNFWNDFWYELPDSKHIHRNPFYDICDLAEGDYLMEN